MLVVLGMLAFIVMSATAFSIYMRQNRLPSSFLRQRIASALLVKAALAQAMNEIDVSIGDDPYPNEWQVAANGGTGGGWLFNTNDKNNGNASDSSNYWRNRVYMGAPTSEGIEPRSTVSTLCLEALAYLPPPLVNTVRYWSRRSPSAQWRYLDYDAGRWAFSAVNVSDYLDINALRADVMRDSSSSNRISLAYRFENEAHTGWGTVKPSDFDAAMQKFRSNAEFGRLVSLADYNMAMGDASGKVKSPDKGNLGYVSPFCDYILKATSLRPFYGSIDENQIRQQTFLTDSWHPYIATNETDIVLSDFADDDFFVSKNGSAIGPSLKEIQKYAKANTPFERIQDVLSYPALGALYDYLDEDSVPISLAIPTIERTPMITGFQVSPRDFTVKFKHGMDTDAKATAGAGGTSVTYDHHFWEFAEIDGTLEADICAVFPFKRSSGIDNGTFTAQFVVKGFLTDDPGAFDKVRLGADFRPTVAEWNGEGRKFDADACFIARGSTPLPVPGSIQKPAQTLIEKNGIELALQLANPEKRRVFAFKIKKTKDPVTGTVTESEPEDDPDRMGAKTYAYMGADGKAKSVKANSISGYSTPLKLKMVYLAWARIVDGDGKTVDLVPATLTDDSKLNGMTDHEAGEIGEELFGKLCGDDTPVFPIVGSGDGGEISAAAFNKDGADVTVAGDADRLSLLCDDPRYNFAPEDWYRCDAQGGIGAQVWLDNVTAPDQDIFQFVSNAGYLQSIGELQFLPWTGQFSRPGSNSNPEDCEYCKNAGRYNSQWHQRNNPANTRYMWRTYCAFGPDRDRDTNGKDMYQWGIVDSRGGASVPPYSSNGDLFMAGLANTPYDWIVADRFNGYDSSKINTLCFNERSSEAKLKWADLEKIADRMRTNFRQKTRYEEWDEWDSSEFFGVLGPDDGIHDVDRKFLFSYWKNCFADTQQLFLLFVRAEPTMMMGGGTDDHTPAQLGAKAVALVWREPVSSITSSAGESGSSDRTHRMRILFYHQFE